MKKTKIKKDALLDSFDTLEKVSLKSIYGGEITKTVQKVESLDPEPTKMVGLADPIVQIKWDDVPDSDNL